MENVKDKTINFIKGIDRRIVFISAVITITLAYYINTLGNVELTEWNRTFCSAIMEGISIDKRIGNFYKLFFVYLPVIFALFICLNNWLFKIRSSYKDIYTKISIIAVFAIVSSYISRFADGETRINDNLFIQSLLLFFVILFIITITDRAQVYSFSDITMLFIAFMIATISSNILLRIELITSTIIIGLLIISYSTIIFYAPFGRKIFFDSKNIIYILMWVPTVIRVTLEGIYYFTEKGRIIERYYSIIVTVSLIFIVFTGLIVAIIRKKIINLSILGYVGAITSLGFLSFFQYSYQYICSYSNFSNLYELGNPAVAMDTVLYGKIPIIDYFSAHALSDVWTKIIYCLTHGDINGIFTDPYGGLSIILSLWCLFYIVKELFDKDVAVLFVCLFPFNIVGIKVTSLCFIALVMLIYIIRKPNVKGYILFWLSALLGAFVSYDEGISLGISCILAYVIFVFLQKRWKELKQFVLCGASIGILAFISCIIYAVCTGIPIIMRIREWISVSVGSSSSWATANFGDTSSFAFLISYFAVPISAIVILTITVFKLFKTKKNPMLATVIVTFALTEIIYISRTIVYHNLAVCSGITGVLLNFIHWTVSLYVLYVFSLKGDNYNKNLFAWVGTFGAVILAEGTLVTGILPGYSSILYANAAEVSEQWDLKNNITENYNEKRIVFDEETTSLVNQFRSVFDTLLTDEETFLDFANVTSMYALTGRKRPFYVGQSPSLLTDLYSQECFLNEVSEYDCPLTIVGTTESSYLQHMVGIPHNVRYYKIAEYVYDNYRPLVKFGEFVIWCEKDLYDSYCSKLRENNFEEAGYMIVDYGYDLTTSYIDDNGNLQYNFAPYHSYDIGMIPYIWANYDDYNAINNSEIISIKSQSDNYYVFEGSQTVVNDEGNYIAFECTNNMEDDISVIVIFQDSKNDGARFQYSFTAIPGTHQYMIRVSQDYFWDIYNIDEVAFVADGDFAVDSVRILQGD